MSIIIIQISLALLAGVCRNKQLVDGINFMRFTSMHAVRLKEALKQGHILFCSEILRHLFTFHHCTQFW